MAIFKNTPKYLNLDDDERFLNPDEIIYSLNTRSLSSTGGNRYVTRNVKGNELNPNDLPSDTYTCIGFIKYQERNEAFYFLAASEDEDNHSILRYNSVTGNIDTILTNRIFKFVKSSHVQGFAVTAQNGTDTLLYFTDGINPPFKINVNKARKHTLGDYVDGYPQELSTGDNITRYGYVEWAKPLPINPPTFVFGTDENRQTNQLENTLYQFRYSYVYKDGEETAFSPASKVAYSPEQIKNGAYTSTLSNLQYNYLDITLTNGNGDVDKIRVAARENNLGEWKEIKVLDNLPQTTQTFRFYGDGLYSVIDTNKSNKLYDAVPLQAFTATFAGNKAILGNAVDGYNLLNLNYSDNGVVTGGYNYSVTPVYNERPDLNQYKDRVIWSSVNGSNSGGENGKIAFVYGNFTNFTDFQEGDYIYLEFSISAKVELYIGAIHDSSKYFSATFSQQYIVQAGDTLSDIIQYFADSLNGVKINGVEIKTATNNSPVLELKLRYDFSLSGIQTSSRVFHSVQNPTDLLVSGTLGKGSFKTGASHPFGIVYFDRNGRCSTVNKLKNAEPYVKFYYERANDGLTGFEELGDVDMHWAWGGTPPEWATHWAYVYGGNTSVDRRGQLQFSGKRAYKNVNTSLDNRVYVSLESFKDDEIGYKYQFGAKIDYEWTQGDRLRIISIWDGDTSTRSYINGTVDFEIIGYEYLEPDTSTNPIYVSGDDNTWGWFLIIEENDIDGYSASDLAGTNNWFDSSALESAFWEIYRPINGVSDNLYYEMGEIYEIGNAGTSTAYHKGQLRDENETDTIDCIGISSPALLTFKILVVDGTNTLPFIVGEKVTFSGTTVPAGSWTIKSYKFDASTGYYYIRFVEPLPNITLSGDAQISNATLQAVGIMDEGDVWFKPRLLIQGDAVANNPYVEMVEDYYLNDFFTSDSYSRGRANAYTPNAKQTYRKATLWHSENFLPNDNINGLSAFNLANAPYKDLENTWGGIYYINGNGEYITCIQENKCSRVPIDRNLIFSASGEATLTLSNTVIAEPSYYFGDFGCNKNSKSVVNYDGRYAFLDLKRGKACRLSTDGLTAISDYKVSSYFDDKSLSYMQKINDVNVIGGYDRHFEEVMFTFPYIKFSTPTVADGGIDYPMLNSIANAVDDGTNIVITGMVKTVQNPPSAKYGNEERLWSEICEDWGDWGYVYVDLADFAVDNTIYTTSAVFATAGSSYYCLVRIPTSNGNYYAQATVNLQTGVITIPKNQPCGGFAFSVDEESEILPETISFHEPSNQWQTFYSFIPEFYGDISNEFISFYNGDFYKHNVNNTHNNFYGTQYTSILRIVSKGNPSEVDVYKAMSIEGSDAWGVNSATTNLNATSIPVAFFEEKEGFWYSYIPMSTTGTTDGNIIGLGEVSISGNTITIEGLTMVGVFVGDSVYSNDVLIGTVVSVDSTSSLTLSSVVGLNNGDFAYIKKTQIIDGDSIRGYSCIFELENDSTSTVELFAVNIEASESKYHNVR